MSKIIKDGTIIRLVADMDNDSPWYLEYYLEDGTKYGKRIRATYSLNRIKDKRQRMDVARMHLARLQDELGYNNRIRRRVIGAIDAIEEAIEYKIQKTDRPKSISTYRSLGNIMIQWLRDAGLSNINIKMIDRSLVMGFLDNMMRIRKLSNCTYNNYIAVLRSIFFELADRNIIDQNPFSNIKELKVSEPARRAMSNHEKITLIEAIRASDDWSLTVAVMLLYYTFIRPSELRRLKFRNIDLDKGVIYMSGQQTKNKENAQITMPVSLVDRLRDIGIDRYDPDWYVFGKDGSPHADTPIGEHTLNRRHSEIIKKLKKKKGIDLHGISLYSWKDTGAMDMLEAGVSINRLKGHIRHKNLSDTQRYLKPLAGRDEVIRHIKIDI